MILFLGFITSELIMGKFFAVFTTIVQKKIIRIWGIPIILCIIYRILHELLKIIVHHIPYLYSADFTLRQSIIYISPGFIDLPGISFLISLVLIFFIDYNISSFVLIYK